MTFWGMAATGESLFLGEPLEVSLSYDRDAPADLLRVKFPADRLWGELEEVLLLENGETVFRSVVDEQNTALSASGLTVELVARSLEALLLDNEAQPGVMNSPSLPVLEDRLLKPLGLALGEGDRDTKRGALTVNQGESCWTVLERFCGGFLGVVPFVDREGRVQCSGVPGTELELEQVLSAQISRMPCRRIGEVWQQSCRGLYDTRYRNPRHSVRRRRYLSAESGQSPKTILEAGDRDSFLLTVTCAGARWPGRNATASVTLPEAGRFENCPVRGARYLRDKSGERTRLVLESPLFLEGTKS